MKHLKWICCILLLTTVFTACTGNSVTPESYTDTMASAVTAPDVTADTVVSQLESSVAESSEESASSADSSQEEKKTASSKNSSKAGNSSKTSSAASKPIVTKKADKNETEIVTYTKRPTYASVQKEMKALAEKYPDLISMESIGTSVQGRDLTLLKVGKGVAKACIVGGIHAREHITVSYVMRCVEEFCAAYESKSGKFGKYDMVNLLNSYTLYIVPLVNPDGLEIIAGRDAPEVKITYRIDKTTNKLTTMADYKANANGVNLNKNFPFLWDKVDTKRPTPDPENYKGTAAASEPETKALMALCENNDFMWMTSIHVRGDCIYWSDTENPSVGQSEKIADLLEDNYGFYKCKTSDDVNGFGGGFENWFRETYNRPGFCLELMPLTEKVSAQSDENHKYFSDSVRWDTTKAVLPVMMIYGYIR